MLQTVSGVAEQGLWALLLCGHTLTLVHDLFWDSGILGFWDSEMILGFWDSGILR